MPMSANIYHGTFARYQKEPQICPFHQNLGLVVNILSLKQFSYNCTIGKRDLLFISPDLPITEKTKGAFEGAERAT